MNKIKRFVTAALCAVMVFGVIVSNAYEAHAITEFALGIALQILNKAGATTSELDAAKYTLRHSWDSVTVTSANLQEVTGDDLQSIAATLTASGIPCHVVSTTSVGGSGVRGYWIVCDAEPFYTSKSAYTRIDSSQTYTGKHYGIFSYSSTYEVYKYVYAKRENSGYYLSSILDYVIDIKNYLTTNIYPAIDQIEGYIAGLPNYIQTATAWLSTQASNLSAIVTNTSSTATKLDRLVVTTDGVTQTAAELLRLIFDRLSRLAVTRDNTTYTVAELEYNIYSTLQSVSGYVDGVESTLNTISSRVNTTNTRLNTVNSNLTSIGGKIDNIEIPEPIDYTDALSKIIGNTTDEIYVTLYTDDSNGNQYSTLSYRPEIIDGIISYLTTNMQNKPLKVLSRDDNAGVVSQEVRYFMLANFNNGYIRLRVKSDNGTFGFAYLSTPNRVLIKYDNTYVDDSTFYQKLTSIETAINSISTDNSSVVAAIDRIYEWLDNADLATNATIVQVVQDYSHDVNHSVDWASRILDLFKRVYIFDRPAPSFSGILDYFSSLGSD